MGAGPAQARARDDQWIAGEVVAPEAARLDETRDDVVRVR